MKSMHTHQHKGIALIEVILGVGILSLILMFISYTLLLFIDSSDIAREQTKAVYLAEGGQELLRHLRDEDWTNLSDLTAGATYYLDISTSSVAVSGTPEVIDGTYTRSFVVDELERDGDYDFVESGGTVDPEGRVVTVNVSWGSRSTELVSILTNHINNEE